MDSLGQRVKGAAASALPHVAHFAVPFFLVFMYLLVAVRFNPSYRGEYGPAVDFRIECMALFAVTVINSFSQLPAALRVGTLIRQHRGRFVVLSGALGVAQFLLFMAILNTLDALAFGVFVVGALATAGTSWLTFRMLRGRGWLQIWDPATQCENCGYPVRGSFGKTCPECGAPVPD